MNIELLNENRLMYLLLNEYWIFEEMYNYWTNLNLLNNLVTWIAHFECKYKFWMEERLLSRNNCVTGFC